VYEKARLRVAHAGYVEPPKVAAGFNGPALPGHPSDRRI